ncbi:MAG TPA: hypothetical protein VKS60_18495 [Stellaceae bacterium]|nr:hypothetical protein [Stellaceae bacterium]
MQEAYTLFLLGTVLGTTGLFYLFFRARKTVPYEIMLGMAMSLIGWTMAAVGGVLVLFL